ncbi:hypothetical protein KM043_010025 [Ampulex compressa]|nr:hypothetical protein KM043_010025 [Ampulex compressa]
MMRYRGGGCIEYREFMGNKINLRRGSNGSEHLCVASPWKFGGRKDLPREAARAVIPHSRARLGSFVLYKPPQSANETFETDRSTNSKLCIMKTFVLLFVALAAVATVQCFDHRRQPLVNHPTKEASEIQPEPAGRGHISVSGEARKGSSTRGKTEGQIWVRGEVRFRRSPEPEPEPEPKHHHHHRHHPRVNVDVDFDKKINLGKGSNIDISGGIHKHPHGQPNVGIKGTIHF